MSDRDKNNKDSQAPSANGHSENTPSDSENLENQTDEPIEALTNDEVNSIVNDNIAQTEHGDLAELGHNEDEPHEDEAHEEQTDAPKNRKGLRRVFVLIIGVFVLLLGAMLALPRMGVELPAPLGEWQSRLLGGGDVTPEANNAQQASTEEKPSENHAETPADTAADEAQPDENSEDNTQANATSDESDEAQNASADEADKNAQANAQAEALAASQEELAALNADNAALQSQIDALKSENAALSRNVQELEASEKSVEERMAQAEADAQAQIESAIAEVKASALSPEKAQALTELYNNAAQGLEISDNITSLKGLGVEIPANILAITSLPKASDLQEDFNDYALEAVRASISQAPNQGVIDALLRPLRVEFASRSIVPIMGNNPDAVLSRAEASMRNGNLESALGTVMTLPSEAKEAMQPWIEQAEIRVNGLFAIEEFINSQLVGGA